MAQLTPYIHFSGKCQEAMTFYQQVLGGQLDIQKVGDSPMAEDLPAEAKDSVLHAALTNEHLTIMASDMGDDKQSLPGGVSLCLYANSKDEIEPLFDKLADGGQVAHPLEEAFFGTYGDLTDKFGVSWMFQAGGPQG